MTNEHASPNQELRGGFNLKRHKRPRNETTKRIREDKEEESARSARRTENGLAHADGREWKLLL